jgi:hypothetical protein
MIRSCFGHAAVNSMNSTGADNMSGPIVRTGTTPEFWRGWDLVFGDKSAKAAAKSGTPAEKNSGKKAAKKSAKKAVAKKKK